MKIFFILLVLIVCYVCSGCASTTGITPCVSVSYDRAEHMAQKDNWVRIEMDNGDLL